VDGTGSGSCPVAEFSISGAEPSDSAAIFYDFEEKIINFNKK
jgi:hypothetical protein